MKKLFYYVLVAFVIMSCTLSPEQKAEKLIKDSLKKTLLKPDTYKPVETKVDSAFSPNDNPEFYEEFKVLSEMLMEYDNIEEEMKSAKSSMSIWSGAYQSAFGKNEYQEAKDKYDKANEKLEKLKVKGREQYDKVATMLQEDKKFIGYKASHNYRADNNAGSTLIGNTVFIIDKNFEEVLYDIELDDYNDLQKAIKQFKEQIDDEK